LLAIEFAMIGNKGVGMNIKGLGLTVALVCCAVLAGCSTSTVVTLQNGTQYVTKDAPKTKSKDGFYEFQDISGKTVKVRADEVATVKEED
jgi:major membrane immunogen (membrane-anchored lipoprotein)